jgi:hypothetical protein
MFCRSASPTSVKVFSFDEIFFCSRAAGIEAENPLKVLLVDSVADLQRIARTNVDKNY